MDIWMSSACILVVFAINVDIRAIATSPEVIPMITICLLVKYLVTSNLLFLIVRGIPSNLVENVDLLDCGYQGVIDVWLIFDPLGWRDEGF